MLLIQVVSFSVPFPIPKCDIEKAAPLSEILAFCNEIQQFKLVSVQIYRFVFSRSKLEILNVGIWNFIKTPINVAKR